MPPEYSKSKNPTSLSCAVMCLILSVFVGAVPASARTSVPQATAAAIDNFQWVHANSHPQLWEQIQQKFQEELTPDQPAPEKNALDVYGHKYFQKVAVYNHSALVIVGHRPARVVSKDTAWDEYYSAFNLDLATGRKSAIEHAERLWQWKFVKLANFGPVPVPDVTFTYLTCTECEPDSMFSSFYYDAAKSSWQMRQWGDGKDLWWTASDGLVVELDLIGDGDVTFFDCVYGILSSQDARFQNLAMRCKEFTEPTSGVFKVVDDTVLYGLTDGQFKARRVTNSAEVLSLTQRMCKPAMKSFLCRLPADMPPAAGQHEILKTLLPNAPAIAHDPVNFRTLKRSMTVSEIASRCGLPDELGGSGVYVFSYHLTDGTFVNISATGINTPILYANHLDAEGRGSDLVSVK